MKIVILGSTGQLGQDLLTAFGPQATGLTHQDVDVCDGVGILRVLQNLKPDWVLNTAAYHQVDQCEVNPEQALRVNGLGAHNVARAAAEIGAGVVFFSTDYVFDGRNRGPANPYLEDDAPNPINVYGTSKVAGERLTALANPHHIVIRSSALFGLSTSRKGWTFPELILNKGRQEGKVRVVDNRVTAPTYTHDLALKVKELVERDITGLIHLASGGECSWFGLSREVFNLANVKVDMEPIVTAQAGRRAPRPAYSAMASSRLEKLGIASMRSWREALRDYMQKKGM